MACLLRTWVSTFEPELIWNWTNQANIWGAEMSEMGMVGEKAMPRKRVPLK